MPYTPSHTPGPWRSETDRVVTNDGELTICDVRHAGTWITDLNTRLIAAAPELLQALELLLKEHKEGYHSGSSGFDLAVGAVSKALKGEWREWNV